ncbi:MAG: hypothetical protein U0804_12525 [Gemmataceae bacterium]
MARLYHYVGPAPVRERVAGTLAGVPIAAADDLSRWVDTTGQKPEPAGRVTATFVVDEQGVLLVADRRSEHIACSGGLPVLSAGEMFLSRDGTGWRVDEVSNQSTGFCPEPESWPAVAAALGRAGIPHSGGFTSAVVFRRCPRCSQRNVVRDGWFVCAACGADLPAAWNFAEGG